MNKVIRQLRDFPSIEELLQHKKISEALTPIPRPLAAILVRESVAATKKTFTSAKEEVSLQKLVNRIVADIEIHRRRQIGRVINATGVVVHTNLGRAPLSTSLFDSIKETVTGYGNIEFELQTGVRGGRGGACEQYLALLSEAERATVVNNCAAALFVTLNTFANRKNVIISRGELVQIGGGFRIPDILKKSGARLHEIGTTNITSLKDYESAIDERTGLILKVHQSNFVQRGFTEGVPLKELVALGKKHQVMVVNDLGSGVFVPTREVLGYAEPTVQQSVRDGADVTCFSGDKMLGGCQAGLIVGKAPSVDKIKKNPLFRTMRADKIVFSMLERLLSYYLDGTWQKEIKLWALLTVPESELYKRGKAVVKEAGNPPGVSVEATKSYVGGGALPESNIPSVGIVFSKEYKAVDLISRFRNQAVPIIGRIDDDRFILDLKAVDAEDLPLIREAITKILP